MKTLPALATTALLSWLGSTAVAAAPPAPPANANFASERGLAFGLRLDGQPLTRPVARQVHVDRLAPGQHWADFSLPTPYGPPMRFRTQVWLEPGFETSYVLVLRPGFGPQLRQVSAVPVAGPAYGPGGGYPGGYQAPGPGYPGGYPSAGPGYDEGYPAPAPVAPASPDPGGYYGGQPNTPNNYPGNAPYGNDPGPAGSYGNPPASTPPPNGSYPGGYEPNGAPAPNGGGYYPNPNTGNYLYPLPPADVQNLTQTLRSQPVDEQRLPTAKQALAQGTVRADELAELINTMSFNRSRVDLAKYGYAHLSDPQNFYRVYDVLQYPSSIREVQQALGLPQN